MKQILHLYKNAYSGLSGAIWNLAIVMLINRSGTMVVPFMALYCTQHLHFTIAQTGTLLTCMGCGSIVGALFGGWGTNKFGFYTQQLFALSLGGVLFIITGFITDFISLCIISFLLNCFNESFRPANGAAMAAYSNAENRARSIGIVRLAVNLGWAVGSTLGGFLAAFDYRLLFWVDGVTNIGAAALLFFMLPKPPAIDSATIKEHKQKFKVWKDTPYMRLIICNTIFACCFFMLFNIQPLFYKTEWHLTEQVIGWVMALNGLLIVFFEMIILSLVEKYKLSRVIVFGGVVLVGIGYLLQNILPAGTAAAVIVALIITFGEMLSLPFINAWWVSFSNESNRGSYAATYTLSWSIAQIAAPAFGAWMIATVGFDILWYTVAVCCTIAAIGFYALVKDN